MDKYARSRMQVWDACDATAENHADLWLLTISPNNTIPHAVPFRNSFVAKKARETENQNVPTERYWQMYKYYEPYRSRLIN